MASVDAAAPTDGAPLLASHNLDARRTFEAAVGKRLNRRVEPFLFGEPTGGVDVGVVAETYRLLVSLLKQGVGIIMISSYLPEVYELAGMLRVIRAGRFVASHGHKDTSVETVLTEAIEHLGREESNGND